MKYMKQRPVKIYFTEIYYSHRTLTQKILNFDLDLKNESSSNDIKKKRCNSWFI